MTEEYRIQMQSTDKNVITSPPIVVQQLTTNVDPSKGYNHVEVESIYSPKTKTKQKANNFLL